MFKSKFYFMKKIQCICQAPFSLFFTITYAIPIVNVVENNKEIKNEAIINVFTLPLTPEDETCTGIGQIIIDIDNTESGAEFEFQIYQLQTRLNILLEGHITPLVIDGIVGPFT